eukprot:765670-Hanusia_phi.AAC.2
MAFLQGPVRIYPQLEEVTVDSQLPTDVPSVCKKSEYSDEDSQEHSGEGGPFYTRCFSCTKSKGECRLRCNLSADARLVDASGNVSALQAVELQSYQTFTLFWSCKEDFVRERMHAEMHNLKFDLDIFHCLKLFQGEMMSWKEIPHYS